MLLDQCWPSAEKLQEKGTQEQESGLLLLLEPEAAEELWEQVGWELEGTRHQWERERLSSVQQGWRKPPSTEQEWGQRLRRQE